MHTPPRCQVENPLTPDPRGYAYGLAPEILRDTASRLGVAALVYAGAYLVGYASGRFIPQMEMDPSWNSINTYDLFAIFFIVLALGVSLLTRLGHLPPSRLLDLGLFFEVVAAAGIEIGWAIRPDPEPGSGISWTCVWIVFFPLLVPSTPGKMLLATVASAAMMPFMYLIAVARGYPPPGVELVIHQIVPLVLCVGIAVVAYRVVHRLRTDASRAQRLGSYRLVELLGRGGMGEVWRAEHSLLARPAAIKLIRPETLGMRDEGGKREILARFEREAQATSLLGSPHTVELYDFGVTDEGTFYYVMELLRGVDFATLVERFGPVPPGRAVYLLRQACESLAEAHQDGLIHRDVKPANLFACRLGLNHDFVKILDFGLVKSSTSVERGDTQLTMTQGAVGTPAFMAPELLSGEGKPDGRVDIYAVGCVAYWLLTGDLVFTGKTPIEVAIAHINTSPVAPSRRAEIPIPPDLDALVLACLEKRPENRPAGARELGERLGALQIASSWDETKAAQWWELHLPQLARPFAEAERVQVS